MKEYNFTIGGHGIRIQFTDNTESDITLLPSFMPFTCKEDKNEETLFTLTVDDTLRPEPQKTLIRNFDTGNGDTAVYLLPDGGYQYIIRDIHGRSCCLLICHDEFRNCKCALNGNWTMRSFGLNDALMLVYAFAGAYQKTLLIHASCISYKGKAFPFHAKSGTGKSTHTSLWMKYIEEVELMNDDNPIVRIEADGQPYIYGSPWSGKTPCYRNVKVRLGALTRIERANDNHLEREPVVQAFASLLPACSSMKWDSTLYNHLCNTLSDLIASVPVCTMYCKPDEEAARVSCQRLTELTQKAN